jgi:hypothetical protein
MTTPATHPIERAFQMAKSGDYRARSEVSKAMSKEGFTIGECEQLTLPSLSRQLNDLCRASYRGEGAEAA